MEAQGPPKIMKNQKESIPGRIRSAFQNSIRFAGASLEQSLAILDRFLDDSESFLEEIRRNLLASKLILQDLL